MSSIDSVRSILIYRIFGGREWLLIFFIWLGGGKKYRFAPPPQELPNEGWTEEDRQMFEVPLPLYQNRFPEKCERVKVFSYRDGRVGEIKHSILLLQTPYTFLGVEVWGWVGRLFSEQSIWSNSQFSSYVDTNTTIPIGRHSSCLYAENSYQPSYCSWTNLLKMIGGVAGMFSATFFRRVRFLPTGGDSWFCRKDWNKEPHDFKCSSNCKGRSDVHHNQLMIVVFSYNLHGSMADSLGIRPWNFTQVEEIHPPRSRRRLPPICQQKYSKI